MNVSLDMTSRQDLWPWLDTPSRHWRTGKSPLATGSRQWRCFRSMLFCLDLNNDEREAAIVLLEDIENALVSSVQWECLRFLYDLRVDRDERGILEVHHFPELFRGEGSLRGATPADDTNVADFRARKHVQNARRNIVRREAFRRGQ